MTLTCKLDRAVEIVCIQRVQMLFIYNEGRTQVRNMLYVRILKRTITLSVT